MQTVRRRCQSGTKNVGYILSCKISTFCFCVYLFVCLLLFAAYCWWIKLLIGRYMYFASLLDCTWYTKLADKIGGWWWKGINVLLHHVKKGTGIARMGNVRVGICLGEVRNVQGELSGSRSSYCHVPTGIIIIFVAYWWQLKTLFYKLSYSMTAPHAGYCHVINKMSIAWAQYHSRCPEHSCSTRIRS